MSTTDIGGDGRRFPATSWTVVRAAAGEGPEARRCMERLIASYWKPVYWLVRQRWRKSNDDAKELTQEFFTSLLERDALAAIRGEGRFRAFLRGCLENFLRQSHRDGEREKRGGRAVIVAIDPAGCTLDLPSKEETPEEAFDRAWARALLDDCVGELERLYGSTGRATYWQVFERHHLARERPSYRETAEQLGLTTDDVQNRLKHARRSLRDLVRERVRDTLDDPARDLEEEMRYLLACA